MEVSGEPGRIQVSRETGDLLVASGKESWIKARESKVQATKGKGELSTFWLHVDSSKRDARDCNDIMREAGLYDSSTDLESEDGSPEEGKLPGRVLRLIDWSSDLLVKLLTEVEARRRATIDNTKESQTKREIKSLIKCELEYEARAEAGNKMPLDEWKEIIHLPKFDDEAAKKASSQVHLSPNVVNEVKDFMTMIALLYHPNPFHNFEHACHVSMSVIKLLSRIVAPDGIANANDVKSLHDHTYGITSDPLTRFACVFSALIHDVDHRGISNVQLIKEQAQIASRYKGKSIAEQNSVEIAWKLLMDDRFSNFRGAIYSTASELKRFRGLVVNSLMATDIADKELKALRNARWETAFAEHPPEQSQYDNRDRKATIVIEHIIQASDVSHLMQHWHIYRKWNERLFNELYLAHKAGRGGDPSEFWAKGEIGFFDFYIIPLAKKLKECGVFGVSSFEYLNYAIQNRNEWEAKGEQITEQLKENAEKLWENTASGRLVI